MSNFDMNTLLHKENLEQRQKWQITAMVQTLGIILLVILAIVQSMQISNKEVITRYVEFSEKGDFGFKVVADSSLQYEQRQLIIEQQLKNYVEYRVANVAAKNVENEALIDSKKVQFVSAFSTRKVSNQFQEELRRIYNEASFRKRDIEILSYSQTNNRQYRFDFNTIDTYDNGQEQINRWVVNLRYDLVDVNSFGNSDHKIQNPLGVKVTYYRGDIDKYKNIEVENVLR